MKKTKFFFLMNVLIFIFSSVSALVVKAPFSNVVGNIRPHEENQELSTVRLTCLAEPQHVHNGSLWGAIQWRVDGSDGWSSPKFFSIPRAMHHTGVVEIDVPQGRKIIYRMGVVEASEAVIKSSAHSDLDWDAAYAVMDGDDQKVLGAFTAYKNNVGYESISLVYGSCQYDGPLADLLEKSPVGFVDKLGFIRSLGLFSKLNKIPGVGQILRSTPKVNVLNQIFLLNEEQGKFFSVEDGEIFVTLRAFLEAKENMPSAFFDVGDTYYVDWMNRFKGGENEQDVLALLRDAYSTEGRSWVHRHISTHVSPDDHAWTNDFTGQSLQEGYTPLADASMRVIGICEMGQCKYSLTTQQIENHWYETSVQGFPVFVVDTRTEAFAGERKISDVQLEAIKAFLLKWKNHPKLLASQIPLGPDYVAGTMGEADKWGDTGYQATRDALLNFIADNGITNTLWGGGDVHFAQFYDIAKVQETAQLIDSTDKKDVRMKVDGRFVKAVKIKGKLYPAVMHQGQEVPAIKDGDVYYPAQFDEEHKEFVPLYGNLKGTVDGSYTATDLSKVLVGAFTSSPFSWLVQFEDCRTDRVKKVGTHADGSTYRVVNATSEYKENNAGIFTFAQDGRSATIQIVANDLKNGEGTGKVVLERTYQFALPYTTIDGREITAQVVEPLVTTEGGVRSLKKKKKKKTGSSSVFEEGQ